MATIKEIIVYPVKACQGISCKQSKVTSTGLEFDRTWCIVDLEGTHVPKLEAISGRRIPSLATIETSLEDDGSTLVLKAPGMPTSLKLPTSPKDYESLPVIQVESAGATAGGKWLLATMNCAVHEQGSKWIMDYLNSPKPNDDTEKEGASSVTRFVNGKTTKGSFALVRSIDNDLVHLGDYPPIFPLIERAKSQSDYKERFEGSYRRLSDFAPFLLVSQASARALAEYCKVQNYPVRSFRGNLVVDGPDLKPWVEESWYKLKIGDTMTLHTIKACPRCTVPCRDQSKTGEYLFANEKLKLWNVLKAMFPRKYHDPEWGSWAGAYMGVYMGHDAGDKDNCIVKVGDSVLPVQRRSWDHHLQREVRNKVLLGVSVSAAILGIAFGISRKRTKAA